MKYIYAIRMEEWNAGILGVKAETNHFNCKKLLQTHHSVTPSFHYSNWGEAPKFKHTHRRRGFDFSIFQYSITPTGVRIRQNQYF
jgi:hypothetical protein